MIVNARDTIQIIVELTAQDIHGLLKGEDLVRENYGITDTRQVLVRVYCANHEEWRGTLEDVKK